MWTRLGGGDPANSNRARLKSGKYKMGVKDLHKHHKLEIIVICTKKNVKDANGGSGGVNKQERVLDTIRTFKCSSHTVMALEHICNTFIVS